MKGSTSPIPFTVSEASNSNENLKSWDPEIRKILFPQPELLGQESGVGIELLYRVWQAGIIVWKEKIHQMICIGVARIFRLS